MSQRSLAFCIVAAVLLQHRHGIGPAALAGIVFTAAGLYTGITGLESPLYVACIVIADDDGRIGHIVVDMVQRGLELQRKPGRGVCIDLQRGVDARVIFIPLLQHPFLVEIPDGTHEGRFLRAA